MLKVPHMRKQHILDELRLLNITRETLLPGLDEAATEITQRYSSHQWKTKAARDSGKE